MAMDLALCSALQVSSAVEASLEGRPFQLLKSVDLNTLHRS